MSTREEKLERHFRNSVQTKLIELMKIMDPGGQREWSYNYKDLLTFAKERIEAELLHEAMQEEDPSEGKAQGALVFPEQILPS